MSKSIVKNERVIKYHKMNFTRVTNKLRRLMRLPLIFKAGHINVYYHIDHDGGGTTFGQDFIKLFNHLNLRPDGDVFEWCSGPGFIGFKLFDNYDLKSLTMNDINPEVLDNYQRTVTKNKLNDIKFFLGKLSDMPRQKFNLIVANPPHFSRESDYPQLLVNRQRIIDKDWNTHRDFFMNIHNFMHSNTYLILQESKKSSEALDFEQLMKNTMITLEKVVYGKEISGNETFYYLICKVRPKGFEPLTF